MTLAHALLRLGRLLVVLGCWFGAGKLPAQPAARPFDLPAAAAEVALKQLSAQSGREVLFPPDLVEGVRTRAVKGTMTPRAALDAMLAGTALVGVQDEKTGSLTVRRAAEPKKKRSPLLPATAPHP